MQREDRPKRLVPRSPGAHAGDLMLAWRRRLLATGFSEQQTLHLIFAKLLYVRGQLRG